MVPRLPLIAAGLLSACTALAADWASFRGPNRDGICKETGLLQAWPKDGPPKVWTAGGLGIGFGTPSVAGGKIYGIGSRNGKDGVWALNEADGKELWFTPVADTANIAKNTNGPASTPTVHNGKAYVVTSGGTVGCLDAATGKLAWKKSYTADFGGQVPVWGFSDSVLADGDTVVCIPCGPKAAVAALKADTGAVVWAAPLGPVDTGKGGGAGYSSPTKATFGGVPMYVVLLDAGHGLLGLDAKTGKVLWQYKGTAAAGGIAQIPVPVIRDDLVWVSCSYNGGSALLRVAAEGKDKFSVKELKRYSKPELNNHHGGMVLVGDHVYFGHDQNQGYPACVEFKTGEIKWGPEKSAKAVGGGQGSAAVLYADGRLYFRYQNGVLVLIDPSPDGLKVVSSFALPAADVRSYPQSWPHPVVANGRLYVRDQNALHCYNVKADKN
jgi:outer membrane protein assembly factor BamB